MVKVNASGKAAESGKDSKSEPKKPPFNVVHPPEEAKGESSESSGKGGNSTAPAEEAEGNDAGDGLPDQFYADPITGEIVDFDSIDDLIDSYERMKTLNDRLYAHIVICKQVLAKHTVGTTKTRRVIGERRAAKIEMPDDSWDNKTLKELWEQDQELAKQYLRIEKIAPQMREVKKLLASNGNEKFQNFRNRLLAANNGPSGNPTITIEK